MSEHEDAFSGEMFGDFMDTIKPGSRVSRGDPGLLRYRQGNDPRDWSGAGGTKYLPGDWNMQCGSFRKMFTVRKSGGFEVTLPIPFAEPPLVLVSISGTLPAFEEVRFQSTIQSAGVFEVYWWSTNFITRVYINWLALGPIGL